LTPSDWSYLDGLIRNMVNKAGPGRQTQRAKFFEKGYNWSKNEFIKWHKRIVGPWPGGVKRRSEGQGTSRRVEP